MAFRSADASAGTPIYRLYNPYVQVGTHLLTTDASEYEALARIGWVQEGVAFYAGGDGGGSGWDEQVVATPAWDETVVDTPAWDETVVDQEAYDEQVVATPAWDETVVDTPAWDETVVDTPAWDETVVDQEAWDETVVDTPAYDELVKEKTKDPNYTYLDIQYSESSYHTSDGMVFPVDGDWAQYLIDHPGVSAWRVDDIYYARYVHHDATYKTVHHDAVTHVVHHDAVTHTVHHDAVTHVVHHDATYETVHHDATYETVHHDA